MSTQSAMPLPSALLSSQAPDRSKATSRTSGLSIGGVWLFVTAFLVVGSGFTSLRPTVLGLSLHPYLLPVALAFPFVVMARIAEFPIRVLVALLSFMALYFFSVVNGGSIMVSEIVRITSSGVTIITCTLLVRRRGDVVAGALGLSIAAALLAAHGLQEEGKLGVDAIQGANKNSYSLFALPAILMAGYICLHMPTVPNFIKGIFIACTLPALAAIFMSGNRSGYLGSVVVGLMLFWDRRGKGMLLVGAITAAVMFWILQFGSTAMFDQRMKQTVEGNDSDRYRRDILFACLAIGLENPIIGVSPQQLPFEIGRRTSIIHHNNVIDSHNVYAHFFAGSGLICFSALLSIGLTMCTWKPRDKDKFMDKDDPFRVARKLLRMMVFLWAIRGAFTREVLYNPSFNIGFGMCVGLCILAETARKERNAELAARAPMLPARGPVAVGPVSGY